MNKNAGRYVLEGAKDGVSYLIHHFSKVFVFWVFEIVNIISEVTLFMAPVMQKFYPQFCKMVSDSKEAVLSKGFDQSDDKKGYRSLLLFNILWLLFTLAGIALILGIAFLLQTLIMNVYVNSYVNGRYPQDEFAAFQSFTNYLYIPFLVIAAVYLIFALLIRQCGIYASYKNPGLGVSDIIYNAFLMMHKRGWKLLVVNILFMLEILTFAVIVVLPVFLVSYFISPDYGYDDTSLALFIEWILIAVFSVLAIIVIPFLFTSYRLGIHKLMMDCCPSDNTVVAFKKSENKDNLSDLIPLTPVSTPEGEVTYVSMEKKQKKNKDGTL